MLNRVEMNIATPKDLGRIIRQKRIDDGLTLEEAAGVCGVSYAFLSALENGKETVQLNKVLQVTMSWPRTGSECPVMDRFE